MLTEPDVKDEEIIAFLRDAYGLDIATAQDPSAPTKGDHFQEWDCRQSEAFRHKK